MTDQKVSADAANAEFERWLELMGLEHKADEAKLNADDMASFSKARGEIVRAIERGSFVVDEQGVAVFQSRDGTVFRFAEPKGTNLFAMDRYKRDESVHKMYAVIGDWCGMEPKKVASQPRRDGAVLDAVFVLFFG